MGDRGATLAAQLCWALFNKWASLNLAFLLPKQFYALETFS